MALSAEEMYNKYKVADEMWSYNMKQSSDYQSAIMKNPIHRIRIAADEAVWAEFDIRIRKAEELIATLWTE